MRVVLVAPDSVDLSAVHPARTLRKAGPQLPLGLLYVAAAAEAAGHEVAVFDNYTEGVDEEAALDRVLAQQPDCVGFSTAILNIWQGFSLAAAIKARRPEVLTVFGGPQPTIDPMDTVGRDGVDAVVLGEGEHVFVRLLAAWADGPEALEQAPGLVLKRPDGTIVRTPEADPIRRLSELPWPARHLVDLNRYERHGVGGHAAPVDVVATSRGCPFHCAFCSSSALWRHRYRMREAADVVDEMAYMVRTYGSRGFYFREDNFTVNTRHVLSICEEIQRRGLNVTWTCESRVDTLSGDVMARMVEAGCRGMWCGVESGSQRVLDLMAKGVTPEKTREFYRNASQLGIRTGASFMVGVPGETEADVAESFRLARELPADYASFLSYVAFPGSALYDRVCRERLYSREWESIRFVDTPDLPRERILELECTLNRKLRRSRLLRRPLRTAANALKVRWQQRRHAARNGQRRPEPVVQRSTP